MINNLKNKNSKFIVTQTPLRLSFFGGSSDIKEFYKKNGGSVISSTINKYIYVILKITAIYLMKNID